MNGQYASNIKPSATRRALLVSCIGSGLGLTTACGGGSSETVAPTDSPAAPVTPAETAASSPSSQTTPAPFEVLDMSHLSLTLPIDENGGTTGIARTLKPSELTLVAAVNHTQPWDRYIYTEQTATGWGVTLWCPVTGAKSSTDPDSTPRTEFRHQLTPGQTDSWDPSLPVERSMSMRFQVKQMPPNKAFIVAQIHGHRIKDPTGTGLISAAPLLLVYFEQDVKGVPFQLRAKIRSTPDPNPTAGGTYQPTILATYPAMPDSVDLQILVADNNIRVAGTTIAVPSTWQHIGVYFKSGIYLTEVKSRTNQGGMISITLLKFS